jgi:Flp pilus assembly protein TadD
MSLLIKALQKAEQSKEAATEKTRSDPPRLELSPHHDEPDGELSLAEESGFHESQLPYQGAAATPTVKTSLSERSLEREAAANVFRARASQDPGGRRAFWVGLSGLALLLLLGISFYLYLDTLQPPEPLTVRPLPQPPRPLAQSTPPLAPTTSPAETAAPVASPTAEPAAAPAPAVEPASSPTETATTRPAAPVEPVVEKPLVTTTPAGAKKTAPPPLASNDDKPAVEVRRGRKAEPAVDATTLAAYQAFIAGDDATAGRLYRQLLQADPRSVDALLGLAAIAVRQERGDEALGHYARVLELEPRNSIAQAGLAALAGESDPVAAQSRVKSLLARQPDDAYLHAILGGLYAEQNQWGDAQQAYFQAYRLDPGNAEHAYNLAISLDQLGKGELALEYYQRALELLPRQGGSVDRTVLETRIARLRSALGK